MRERADYSAHEPTTEERSLQSARNPQPVHEDVPLVDETGFFVMTSCLRVDRAVEEVNGILDRLVAHGRIG